MKKMKDLFFVNEGNDTYSSFSNNTNNVGDYSDFYKVYYITPEDFLFSDSKFPIPYPRFIFMSSKNDCVYGLNSVAFCFINGKLCTFANRLFIAGYGMTVISFKTKKQLGSLFLEGLLYYLSQKYHITNIDDLLNVELSGSFSVRDISAFEKRAIDLKTSFFQVENREFYDKFNEQMKKKNLNYLSKSVIDNYYIKIKHFIYEYGLVSDIYIDGFVRIGDIVDVLKSDNSFDRTISDYDFFCREYLSIADAYYNAPFGICNELKISRYLPINTDITTKEMINAYDIILSTFNIHGSGFAFSFDTEFVFDKSIEVLRVKSNCLLCPEYVWLIINVLLNIDYGIHSRLDLEDKYIALLGSEQQLDICLKYKNLLSEIDKFSSDKFLLLPLIDELRKNITKKSIDFFLRKKGFF